MSRPASELTLLAANAGASGPEPVLSVRDLRVHFFTDQGVVRAVDGVSLHVKPHETMALVGESGCGKTVAAGAMMRLVRHPGRIVSGKVVFSGEDILSLPESRLRKARGRDIAMIFQEPMSSLNPAFTIGWQIAEVIRLHHGLDQGKAQTKAIEMLDVVRIPEAAKRFHQYPHELSGGMTQRVMIAIALSCRPRPGGTLLLITHSLGVVAEGV